MRLRWRARWWLIVPAVVLLALAVAGAGVAGGSPDSCGRCHAMSRYVESYRSSRDLDHAHREAGVGCRDCHATTWAHQLRNTATALASRSQPPSRIQLGDGVCNRCHVGMVHQAAKTDFLSRNPHRSHWPELRCGDCHRTHGQQVDFCSGCHENGGQRMTGDPAVPRARSL